MQKPSRHLRYFRSIIKTIFNGQVNLKRLRLDALAYDECVGCAVCFATVRAMAAVQQILISTLSCAPAVLLSTDHHQNFNPSQLNWTFTRAPDRKWRLTFRFPPPSLLAAAQQIVISTLSCAPTVLLSTDHHQNFNSSHLMSKFTQAPDHKWRLTFRFSSAELAGSRATDSDFNFELCTSSPDFSKPQQNFNLGHGLNSTWVRVSTQLGSGCGMRSTYGLR